MAVGSTAYVYPASSVGIHVCRAIMGYSRTGSLLLCRVFKHSDIVGFYQCRFDLFAIKQFASQSSIGHHFFASFLFKPPRQIRNQVYNPLLSSSLPRPFWLFYSPRPHKPRSHAVFSTGSGSRDSGDRLCLWRTG
jgi:hypothetical protein